MTAYGAFLASTRDLASSSRSVVVTALTGIRRHRAYTTVRDESVALSPLTVHRSATSLRG
jgi:hypothetical protein